MRTDAPPVFATVAVGRLNVPRLGLQDLRHSSAHITDEIGIVHTNNFESEDTGEVHQLIKRSLWGRGAMNRDIGEVRRVQLHTRGGPPPSGARTGRGAGVRWMESEWKRSSPGKDSGGWHCGQGGVLREGRL